MDRQAAGQLGWASKRAERRVACQYNRNPSSVNAHAEFNARPRQVGPIAVLFQRGGYIAEGHTTLSTGRSKRSRGTLSTISSSRVMPTRSRGPVAPLYEPGTFRSCRAFSRYLS
mmetsp:Transcript_65217/g.160601  ORF Transcript_65217/g.160601 Transcript_65217/m.160601 type:complete len:114 (-) Transcript_65217:791-1132(-)